MIVRYTSLLARRVQYKLAAYLFIGGLLLGASVSSHAVDLTSGRVPVADTSLNARSAAFTQAFDQVLVKLGGNPNVLQTQQAKDLRANANQWVRSYRYISVDTAASDKQQIIEVSFNERAVLQAVEAAGLPYWRGERPKVLVWIVVERAGQREFIADEDEWSAALHSALMTAAYRRGIDVVLPLLDAQDRQALKTTDVMNDVVNNIRVASARYGTPAALVGYVNDNGSTADARWSLHFGGDAQTWRGRADNAESAVAKAVDDMVNIVAQQSLGQQGASSALNKVLLRVDGATSARDYANVLQYLKKQTFIEQVTPINLQGDRIDYQIQQRSDIIKLQRALDASNLLQPASRESSTRATNNSNAVPELHYTLRR
ncbi:MAG: DUF2066 domain-containing protein [Gammaproteobacteria bacterium]|nr:DUF2066 domain-containing protein [Gammaproteobacteria bacterium]